MLCGPTCTTLRSARGRHSNRDKDRSVVARLGAIPEVVDSLGPTSKVAGFGHKDVGGGTVNSPVRTIGQRRRL